MSMRQNNSIPVHPQDHFQSLYTQIHQDLPLAIPLKQFFLVFQPIVDIADGRTISYEALIRWHHPELGVINPSDFIPALFPYHAVDDGIDPAVFLPPLGRAVICDALGEAIPLG